EVYGFDTSSRPLSQDEASKRVEEAANHLLGLQVHRLFKHNDSLLQGHVGIELRAFASATSRPVVYAPACPNRGRVTINGRHREVDSAGQPINGGVDVDLLELLDKSGGLSAHSLSLAELRSGMAASILSGAKD